jgi:TRAP-type mannitol/chloroaromatic compound transport system permease small subunit
MIFNHIHYLSPPLNKGLFMQFVLKFIKNIIDTVGSLCSIIMIMMVLNVFYDVISRYFFNNVSIGMQELEWHLFAAMFMFGIGYTLKEDGHVRVDVFYDKLSERAQATINILGAIFFALPITVLVLYFGSDYAFEAFKMAEGSPDPGGLPYRWIVRAIIPVSSAFLLLCLLYVTLNNISLLKNSPQSKQGELS